MKSAVYLLLSFTVMFSGTSGCSVSMYSENFHHAAVNEHIKLGMTKEEIRQVLGTPHNAIARATAVDLREVWTYTDRNWSYADPGSLAGWITFTAFTLGFGAIFFPPPRSTHHIIFSNEKVLGWDLQDPFAPDLIIEKRER